MMAAESICDGCERRVVMTAGQDGNWHKPASWYERSDKDGIQTACSRQCIEKIAEKTNKTGVVLPV